MSYGNRAWRVQMCTIRTMRSTISALPEVHVALRVSGFSYAIRNIVAEAKKVEAAGRQVRYLNIGDPIQFGFVTPPHLVEAVARALRDGHNGYTPSPGILDAREAVAEEFTGRGFPVAADRVLLTSGTSEGIELTLGALVDPDDEVLVPVPTYPLYTAVLAKLGARTVYYRTDPARGWQPDVDHIASLVTPRTRALVLIDPNNPTGAVYSLDTKLALIDLAEHHGFPILSDEVYGDLAYAGPVAAAGIVRAGRRHHCLLVALEGVPRAGLARRLDGGGPDASPRSGVGRDQEAGRRPAVQPRADAVCDRGGAAG